MAEFVDMLNKCGVTTPREFPPVVYPDRNATVYSAVTEAKARAQAAFGAPAALVLVVLPDTGAALYREVKQASDSMLGLPTQCIVSRKAGIGCPARGRPQYCANVAMKVNAKLGGCNTRLGDVERLPVLGARRPFMILGADVTHPRPGEGGPSIAAVVGSMDATATRYAARVTMQRGGQEIVAELKAMVKSLLLEFYGATRGMRPESLLFYRDGVSESQFQEVYYKEYSALLEACAEMGDAGAEYRPPITFVIVQKRHHTRFFPKSTDQSNRDRSGNVLPGTVVDNDIAHPHDFSFYLNSHSGIQGTSKPAHYSVLVDENKFGADGMQLLTYHLCYLFCRCTRSISVCPPAQYAHLAAFRGRLMLRGEGGSDTASSASGGGGGTVEFMSINPRLQKAMFYV
ncbi:AGO1 [Auxenochlorella protothecoides x Auxenochlorella symbiontica]